MRISKPIEPAGQGARAASSRAPLLTKWANARRRFLLAAVTFIERGVKRGEPVARLVRKYGRRHGGRALRGGLKPKPSSGSTIARAYYQWKADGANAPIFALNYKPGIVRKVDHAELARFVAACLEPDIRTFKAGFLKMPEPAGNYSTYRRLLRRGLHGALLELFRARQRVGRIARKVEAMRNGEKRSGRPQEGLGGVEVAGGALQRVCKTVPARCKGNAGGVK